MKEVFIERSREFIRIAVEKDKNPILFYMEDDNELFPGQIYKGNIKNIVPAIKGGFVDIGVSENVYINIDTKFNNKNLKKGDEVIVEVLKDKEENKKAKVTSAFSLPGRYVVLDTLNIKISFSQKIKDAMFISQIKDIVQLSNEFGFIIRSNAENVNIEEILNEISKLKDLYYSIVNKARYSRNNGLIYNSGGVIEKVLRDVVDKDTTKIYTNNKDDYEFIKNYIDTKMDINTVIEFYSNERTLFHSFGLEEKLLNLLNKKIILNSGGFIVIDKTEAMHVIDVNSGKSINNTNLKETSFKINLEAAKIIAKQIILRNIGGIIVVDFIDLKDEKDKKLILQELQETFDENNDKVVIYPFTKLNLVQIVRRKKGKSILEYIEDKCNSCTGSGSKIKFSYICTLINNEIIKYKNSNNINEFMIIINNYYKEFIEEGLENFTSQLNVGESKLYLRYSNDYKSFKVEPILYEDQRKSFDKFKVYG